MTAGQFRVLRLLRLNEAWRLVLNPRDGGTPGWTLDGEGIARPIVRGLLDAGLVAEVLRNEEGWVHLALTDAGRAAPLTRERKVRAPRPPPSTPGWGKRGRLSKAWHRKNDPIIVRLRRAGTSVPLIASRVGASEAAVRRVLRAHGLVRRYVRDDALYG